MNESDIELEETKELLEREDASMGLSSVAYVFLAVMLLFGSYCTINIVHYLTDDSVPLVVCPRSFALDAPVLMKPMRDQSAITQDKWVRGFIRRFVDGEYPRTDVDVLPSYQYVVNHSKGDIRRKFQSYVDDHVDIERLIASGYNYRFYLSNLKNDRQPGIDNDNVKIRLKEGTNQWAVSVSGFLVKRAAKSQSRFEPILNFTVEAGKPTIDNPEGLYVVDTDTIQASDPFSGNKEKL